MTPERQLAQESLSDEQIVARVRAGEVPLFELLMRRHNERVYRAVRSVLRNETEIEDAMQEAYVQAFAHLGDFAGRARFATWVTRIAVHEALARRRRVRRMEATDMSESDERAPVVVALERNPEEGAQDRELGRMMESAIDELPLHFRTVFVLRAVQELSVEETAECLDLTEQTVKTRLHRARALLQRAILARNQTALPGALPFRRPRCDRVVAAVLRRILPAKTK